MPGGMVETATQRQLYRQSRHPYTYGLLHSFPNLHGRRQTMTGIPGSPPDLRSVPAGCAFNPRCSYAFGACSKAVPKLLTLCPDSPEQQVACHLYDPKTEPPDLPDELNGAQHASFGTAVPWHH